MLCPSCHTPNRANAKFCKGCGQVLPAEQAQEIAPSEAVQPAPNTAPAEPVAEASHPAMPVEELDETLASSEEDDKVIEVVVSEPAPQEQEEDLSQAPTQILSPDKMVQYQTRRWQQELERQPHVGGADISDIPTMLITPAPKEASANETSEILTDISVQDISEAPTILMDISESPSVPRALAEDYSTVPILPTATGGEATTDQDNNELEAQAPSATPSTGNAEVVMEQVTPPYEDRPTEQEPQSIPAPPPPEQETPQSNNEEISQESNTALVAGTLLNERYEITELLAEDQQSRLYKAVDRQGYKRCWNCGSTDNLKDDEFCISCGAELLNATYNVREYLASTEEQVDTPSGSGSSLDTFTANGHTYVIEQQQSLQASFPTGVHVLAACDSDAGNMRRGEPNEDSTLVLQLQRVHESLSAPLGLYIVADGMGGHDQGQLASRIAIRTISDFITRELLLPSLTTDDATQEPQQRDENDLVELLHNAVENANASICQVNEAKQSDMGCTITGFMLVGDFAYILNVGDSRTYLLRDSKLYKLTTDHSLVGQLVAGGIIEPDEVYTHPQRNQIFRSLGDKLNVQIDIIKQQVHPGDVLLSCSDGLWEMVRDPQIEEILNNAPDPQIACSHLIETANINGGEDNVSAVTVFVR
ncbi:PP2C family serine/threonine-protein phosphatase [Ktedonospora formicarum]|uniref:PPM-type phosphatase domain-containing protein n=1 Tax=Ktedonospora formicarum TaxID=2778364 RepID=A0A8J3HYU0_9CHLR|nr:protein phosphatase 2C domain-containing protein [Ktedonospora formicarum]GHO44476.1 hypothetical protein KSX_26390 [Ktedonospora formicarum]